MAGSYLSWLLMVTSPATSPLGPCCAASLAAAEVARQGERNRELEAVPGLAVTERRALEAGGPGVRDLNGERVGRVGHRQLEGGAPRHVQLSVGNVKRRPRPIRPHGR